jgi:hypothetical protein
MCDRLVELSADGEMRWRDSQTTPGATCPSCVRALWSSKSLFEESIRKSEDALERSEATEGNDSDALPDVNRHSEDSKTLSQ